jgi:hypothetical protein
VNRLADPPDREETPYADRESILGRALRRMPAPVWNSILVMGRGSWPLRRKVMDCLAGVSEHRCDLNTFCPRCASLRSRVLAIQVQGQLSRPASTWLLTIRPKVMAPGPPGTFKDLTDKGLKFLRSLQRDGLIEGFVATREIGIVDLDDGVLLPHVHAVVQLPATCTTLLGTDGGPKSRLRHWLPSGWSLDLRELPTPADRKAAVEYLVKPVDFGRVYDARSRAMGLPGLPRLNFQIDRVLRWVCQARRGIVCLIRSGVFHPFHPVGRKLSLRRREAMQQLIRIWQADRVLRGLPADDGRMAPKATSKPLPPSELAPRPGRLHQLQTIVRPPRPKTPEERQIRRAFGTPEARTRQVVSQHQQEQLDLAPRKYLETWIVPGRGADPPDPLVDPDSSPPPLPDSFPDG